ncbi:MAG TPA: carboxypeptidase M32, partial [Verrucomicrobiae bacterium]|nr:carboxypeptidase M32 [Verrucomicrobiae bacterium]
MRDISLASSAASLLSWDQETYMPPKAIGHRAEQLAFLSGWTHRQFTATEVGDWIKACEDQDDAPESVVAVNVREWRRQYDRQTRLPVALVEEFERVKTMARAAWVSARQHSDFKQFQPHLARIIEINRELAGHWGYDASPYDALLEEFEPGARSAHLRGLFAALKPALVEILGPATERSAAIPEDFLRGEYPVAAQQAFNRKVAEAFGFDFAAGRIDTTTHPFCTGLGPGDCRITTRYDERDFTQSLYGVLHEVGHGLYDQGLPAEHFGTPMGSAVSLGIHESQSRLWENHVGRAAAFWEHWHPEACGHFPGLKRFTPGQIHAAVNRVAPSFIRV